MHQAVEKLKTVMKIACVSLDQRRVQILTADLKKNKKKILFFFISLYMLMTFTRSISLRYGILKLRVQLTFLF